MNRSRRPYGQGHDPDGWGHHPAARTLVAVMVLAACSVPVYPLAGEDAPDLPAGWVPDDGIVTWRFTWDNDVALNSDNQLAPDDLSREELIEDDVPYAATRIGT